MKFQVVTSNTGNNYKTKPNLSTITLVNIEVYMKYSLPFVENHERIHHQKKMVVLLQQCLFNAPALIYTNLFLDGTIEECKTFLAPVV